MYFRPQKQTQLLTVEDDFAHLARVMPNGDLSFEFVFSVSQGEVIKNNAKVVAVSVETRVIAPKPLLGTTSRGLVDTRGLVNNLRTATIDAKSTQQTQQTYTVASTNCDLTAFINNDVLPQLRARVPVTSIPYFNRPRLAMVPVSSVKQSNDPQPVLARVTNSLLVPDVEMQLSSSLGEVAQSLMHDMITRQGLDPSYVLQLSSRSSSETATHGGLSNASTAIEKVTDPATRLLNLHLFPPTAGLPPTTTDDIVNTGMVMVLQTTSNDVIDVPVNIVIPNSRLRLEGAQVTQVTVKFELINTSSQLPIDIVTKVLDLTKHVNVYNTPLVPPQVKVSQSQRATHVNLEIRQLDPGATEVQVFKKPFWIASPVVEDYTLVGTYALAAQDQSLLIQVDLPTFSPVIYRVIPVGLQSTQGSEYTNVVVKPARYSPIKSIAMTAVQVDLGIQIEVRHVPTSVVAIQFLKWNMTTHQPVQQYDIVGGDVGFIDDATRQADILTTIDTDVFDGNVYRYVARLVYLDGHTTDYGDATLEFVQPAPGQVDTTIDNLVVNHTTSPNVTFTIATSTLNTDMDAIKSMLENQRLIDQFSGDVQAQRDQLASLVAHQVFRVDLTTGIRENFGVLTSPSFDDSALRKNKTVNPLVYGHDYRYEIYPLLRAPETLFDGFVKTSTDPVTKKTYTWSPAKYLHPHTLNRGTVVTTPGAKQRLAKDPMSFGIIGSVTTVQASFDNDVAQVSDQVASNFDRYLNVVSWKVLGSISQVDYFLVMKQVHGIRTVLGKAHSEFPYGSCQYVHRITPDDVGSIQYVIVPVSSYYRLGVEAVTNTLLIEAAP